MKKLTLIFCSIICFQSVYSQGWLDVGLKGGYGLNFLVNKNLSTKQERDLLKKYADQAVSFTDCLSFALMRRDGIRECFAFDRHFQAAGFRPVI